MEDAFGSVIQQFSKGKTQTYIYAPYHPDGAFLSAWTFFHSSSLFATPR